MGRTNPLKYLKSAFWGVERIEKIFQKTIKELFPIDYTDDYLVSFAAVAWARAQTTAAKETNDYPPCQDYRRKAQYFVTINGGGL